MGSFVLMWVLEERVLCNIKDELTPHLCKISVFFKCLTLSFLPVLQALRTPVSFTRTLTPVTRTLIKLVAGVLVSRAASGLRATPWGHGVAVTAAALTHLPQESLRGGDERLERDPCLQATSVHVTPLPGDETNSLEGPGSSRGTGGQCFTDFIGP